MTTRKKETMKIGSLKRNVVIENARELEADSRVLEFSFSSELPVERYFGFEILSHKETSVDLSRLNNSAPLLFNHDQDQVIGVIEKAWLKDGRGFCQVRFSKDEDGQKVLNNIKDEIMRNVSVGYQILEMALTKQSDSGNEYTATRWMPYEVSIVAIPADPTVGIGRNQSDSDEKEVPVIIEEQEVEQAESSEENPEEKPVEESQEKPITIPATAEFKGEKKMDPVQLEKERILSITALGRKFNKPELAEQLINNNRSIDDARAAFLDSMDIKAKAVTGNEAVVGLGDKEIRQYSILKAIRAMMDPNNKRAQEEAAFEREVSLAAAQKHGKDARGYMIPIDVLRSSLFVEKRDMTVGTNTAGGHTVGTNLLAGSFIEILSKKSALQRAGAQVLNGLTGNIAIPRQTGAATAYWVGESAAPTESAPSFDQVTMSPKTVGAFVDYSRKLMIQSSMDVEAFVRNDLARILALEIDRVGLYGSGSSNQPLGITGLSGINAVDFAAANPTWAEIVEMESLVAADDADVETMKYLLGASMRGALKTTQKAANTAQFIWEPGNTVNGYSTVVSNQIAAGDVFFGNFADLIMGFWSGLDLLADPYTGSKEGNVRIVAHQDMDVAGRHAQSFCYGVMVP